MFLQLKSAQSLEPINNMIRIGLCFPFFFFYSHHPHPQLWICFICHANVFLWQEQSLGTHCRSELQFKRRQDFGSTEAWGGKLYLGNVCYSFRVLLEVYTTLNHSMSSSVSLWQNLGQCLSCAQPTSHLKLH